jgi:hypothetical protein
MADDRPLSDPREWRLLRGPHAWPMPYGGSCATEAAVIAAGLPYRAVARVEDCPPCFSPTIARYLIVLNDRMEDAERQRLTRVVGRLAGSADAAAVERQRVEYVVLETIARIVSSAMQAAGLEAWAERLRTAPGYDAAVGLAREAVNTVHAGYWSQLDALRAAYAASQAGASADMYDAVYAAWEAAAVWTRQGRIAASAGEADKVAEAGAARARIWEDTVAIIGGALDIGKQAAPINTALIVERMNTIRRMKPPGKGRQ